MNQEKTSKTKTWLAENLIQLLIGIFMAVSIWFQTKHNVESNTIKIESVEELLHLEIMDLKELEELKHDFIEFRIEKIEERLNGQNQKGGN